ncbi:MAG: NAD(P)-binding protein [Pseudomonadota bacterium]
MQGKAIVVGGSIGGLFTATLLRKAGWQVEVYEAAAVPLSGRGTGIVV